MPVIMYHTILNSRDGVYIVSEAQLENDLKELIARGYEFVFPSEVAEFVSGEGSLPEKPVMLTFDDGHYNNLYYGLPILEKYGAKAISISSAVSASTPRLRGTWTIPITHT